jgi:hypothetical protein
MDGTGGEGQKPFPSVSNTVHGDVYGNLLQVGQLIGDVHIRHGERARSRYRQLVERLAPATLIGRSAELAELADFCTASSTPSPYQWWRAPAWAGKSALMATFVLNPPPGVRIVSFFVTARLAGQSDRSAFLDSTLEQLATLLERPLPTANREAHFHGMVDEAASWCAEHGERLVLLVDGLDEDRGVTGADFHSIAALLPAAPPHGARVIVSGRPHPPVPDDVPEAHPLRTPAIVRVLEPSERAQVVAVDMRRELDRLLTGSQVDRDLVGLLVASGGGLTAADLTELVADPDWPRWRIEEHLSGVAGRSFVPLTDPAGAYLLGHEELSTTAATRIGEHRLSGYRSRLHAWADDYRERGWPTDTPMYLLHAYHRVVDTARLIALVSDHARLRRMAEAFGGHHTAITEITTAQRVLLAGDPLDLPSMVLLNVRQHHLASRDAAIPHTLPMAWAVLGEVDRARSLARSMTEEAGRDVAMVEVATSLGPDHPRYAQFLDDAEEAALARDEFAARSMVTVLTTRGVLDRADLLVRSLVSKCDVEQQLEQLSKAMIDAGQLDRAESLIALVDTSPPSPTQRFSREIRRTGQQAKAALLADLATALARQGELERAHAVATTIADPFSRLAAMAALIAASSPQKRGGLLDEVRACRDAMTRKIDQFRAEAGAVACIASAGDHDTALDTWRRVPGRLREEVCADVVERCPPEVGVRIALEAEEFARIALLARIARNVDHGRAVQIARTAFEETRRHLLLANRSHSVRTLLELSEHLGVSFATELESVAADMTSRAAGDQVLVSLAHAAVRSGDLGDARRLLLRTSEPLQAEHRLATIISLLPPSGDLDQAEVLVRSMPRPATGLSGLALCAARAGQVDRAARLAAAAEDAVRVQETGPLARWLTYLVEAVQSRRRANLIAEQAVAVLPENDDEPLYRYTVYDLLAATRALGRFDLTARVASRAGRRYRPPGRLVGATRRLRARFHTDKPTRAPRSAHEIAEGLLETQWTKFIGDLAQLHPGLPERIHDTITSLTAEQR